MFNFIEDIVFFLLNHHSQSIRDKDYTFLSSIERQLMSNQALTEKQHNVLRHIVPKYEIILNLTFPNKAIDTPRRPYRNIFKEKIVKHDSKYIMYKNYFDTELLKQLLPLKRISGYYFDYTSKENYIPYNVENIIKSIPLFQKLEFNIDSTLTDMYEGIVNIQKTPELYLPSVIENDITNIDTSAKKYLISKYGDPSLDNFYIYKDRSLLYGLHLFDEDLLLESLSNLRPLTKQIINRKSRFLQITKNIDIQEIFKSLNELNRFPLLILLQREKPLDALDKTIPHVLSRFKPEEVSVLYRMPNRTEYGHRYNKYISDLGINSNIDKNKKIVYITKEKFPKTLLTTEWSPQSVLMTESIRCSLNVEMYLNRLDLIIHYDNHVSLFNSRKEKFTKISSL